MNPLNSHIIAPSLLSADFTRISDAVNRIESSGGDWIHLDVMDGSFVPNITFGSKMVRDVRTLTKLPLDVHLMVDHPERHIRDFSEAGADHITFHIEAAVHSHRIIQEIRGYGKKAGISLVPSTPVAALEFLLPYIDIVLVMTVNPGFGGQELIPECLEKVVFLAETRKKRGYAYSILVDGGVNRATARSVREAGADVLITGSAFFSSSEPKEEIRMLKGTFRV